MAKDGGHLDGAAGREGLSVDSFPGTWLNTNQIGAGIAKVVITEGSGSLRIRVFEAGGGSLQDWGEAVADTFYASGIQAHKAVAFTARPNEGPAAFRLEANLSKGLLIIACITRGRDGRPGSFVREFFYRAPAGAPEPSGASPGGSAAQPDPRSFLGRWVNTDAGARGMAEAAFRSQGSGLTLHVRAADGSPSADWGEVEAEVLIDPSGLTEGTCVAATYDLGGTKVTLHGWIKLGVLVLASFTRFNENGRLNVFDRDFFYRLPS